LFRYNRHQNRLYIDMDWNKIATGNFIVAKAYKIVEPSTYTDVWKDRWLLRYGAALIKRQWGSNLTKFEGMQLPGGITFNGQKIYDDAVQEIEQLEEQLMSMSYPPEDMVG